MARVAIEYDTPDQSSYIPQVQNLIGELGHETLIVNSHDIIHGALLGCDALTFPGGIGAFEGMRLYGRNFVKCIQFHVASGMGYLGVCGGAYAAGTWLPAVFGLYTRETLRLIDVKPDIPSILRFLPQYVLMQDERLLTQCDISAISHPIIAGRENERVDLVYSGGPILKERGSSVTPLAYYYNGVLSDARGELAIAASQFGRGRVVVSGPHPEAPLEVGTNVGEPCCRWLYESMLTYCLEPSPDVFFPVDISPWDTTRPLPSPALALASIGAFTVGAVISSKRR